MIDERVSLFAYRGTAPVANWSLATGLRQEWLEGPFLVQFELSADDYSEQQLRDWYESMYMRRVSVFMDQDLETWRGYATDMTLYLSNGFALNCNFDSFATRVKVGYTGATTGKQRYTKWAQNDNAAALYGRVEAYRTYSGSVPGTVNENDYLAECPGGGTSCHDAHLLRDLELAHMSAVYNQSVVPAEGERPRLSIQARGAMVIANRIKLSDGAFPDLAVEDKAANYLRASTVLSASGQTIYHGDEIRVSREIERVLSVINQSGGWLFARDIAYNGRFTHAGSYRLTNAVDHLLWLARFPNDDGVYYSLTIDLDGGVTYMPMEYAWQYEFYAQGDGLMMRNGQRPTWEARPGLIRFYDSPAALPETWLPRSDIHYMERATMRDGDKSAAFTARNITPGDRINQLAANRNLLKGRRR